MCLVSVVATSCAAVSDWQEEQDYREGWDQPRSKERTVSSSEFCFREAGVSRFNDVVDAGDHELDRRS